MSLLFGLFAYEQGFKSGSIESNLLMLLRKIGFTPIFQSCKELQVKYLRSVATHGHLTSLY
jgi:hypothetical protein